VVMNLHLRNIDAAKEAVTDLEYISKDDANTHILKLKILMLDPSTKHKPSQ